MSVLSTIEGDLETFFHPIKTAVVAAVADAEAKAKADEASIAADVKTSLANAKAAILADTPGVAADVEALLDKVVEAGVAALAAHGL